MIAVIAGWHQRLAILVFGKQPKACAVVPAAWPLAKIAADGGHVSNLWASDFVRRLGDDWICFTHSGVVSQFLNGHKRSNPQALPGTESYSAQCSNLLDVHQTSRREDIILHQRE